MPPPSVSSWRVTCRAPTPSPYAALTRHGILRERFAVAAQQVDQWKAVVGFDDPDTAYVLLLDAQHRVIWRRSPIWPLP